MMFYYLHMENIYIKNRKDYTKIIK